MGAGRPNGGHRTQISRRSSTFRSARRFQVTRWYLFKVEVFQIHPRQVCLGKSSVSFAGAQSAVELYPPTKDFQVLISATDS